MKRLATVFLLLGAAGAHGAEANRSPAAPGISPTTAPPRTVTLATKRTPDVSYGTLQAPEEFELHAGTTDSLMGTLTRKSDGFTIHFDIGTMAGTHISVLNKDKFALLRMHTIGSRAAYTGIERANGKQTVVTTICDSCERSRRSLEESAAIQLLPPAQRAEKYRDLLERQTHSNNERHIPANFWADFAREEDLLDFTLIVTSYTP